MSPPDLPKDVRADDTDDVEALTAEANAARAKLLRTVEEIDHRAHDAVNVRLQLRRHWKEALGVAVVAGVLVVGGVALAVYRLATRRERRRRQRFLMFRRVWQHPERAGRGDATTFWGKLARSIALSILTTAFGVPLRRGLVRILPEPREADEARTRVAG